MDRNMAEAVEFLCANFMDSSQLNMESLVNTFLKEMERGLEGRESSLMMIPTYVRGTEEIPAGKPVIALDAGGTNLRVALVTFGEDGALSVKNFRKFPMPGVDREVDSRTFFATMAEYLREIVDGSDTIGFCFSYPTEMFESLDGRLIHFSKEVKAKDVEGRFIGEELNEALRNAGSKKAKNIVLLNDTVATLLAGKSANASVKYGTYIGFILGTGTNCSYIEEASKIGKLSENFPTSTQIINMESGGFGKTPRGFIDLEFDAGTVNPGKGTFEKMISGAYLGSLYSAVIGKASKEGLFSKESSDTLSVLPTQTTKELSSFLANPSDKRGTFASAFAMEKDAAVGYCLAERLVERAAKLTAVNLASIAVKTGVGNDPSRPILVTADGTTFYELPGLQEKTRMYLDLFLSEHSGQRCKFVKVEDAPLIGAAIAGLTR
jgi:hexokinase